MTLTEGTSTEIDQLVRDYAAGTFGEAPAPPRLPSTATRRHKLFEALVLLEQAWVLLETISEDAGRDKLSELFDLLDERLAAEEEA